MQRRKFIATLAGALGAIAGIVKGGSGLIAQAHERKFATGGFIRGECVMPQMFYGLVTVDGTPGRWRVFVDGVDVSDRCFAANDREGWAECFKHDASGKPYLQHAPGCNDPGGLWRDHKTPHHKCNDLARETLRGDVRIEAMPVYHFSAPGTAPELIRAGRESRTELKRAIAGALQRNERHG